MNIFVTGATGFVGKPLCDRLIEQNNPVTATIRLSEDQQKLPPSVKSVLIKSLTTPLPTKDLENIQAIIYLAARVHQLNERNPNSLYAYREVNTHAALNIAQQAVQAGVRRFIYLSSIKVNGESTTNRTSYTEQDIPNPSDPYGQSKWEAEQELLKIAQVTNLEIVILRPPLIYGSNVKANFLQLLKLIDKNWPFPLASVQNQRSLLYVGNLVDAIINCIDHPNAKNQTFLVSDGQDLSTPQLIHQLGQAMGQAPWLLPFPVPLLKLASRLVGKQDIGDRLLGSLQVDSSKIRKTLNWQPPYTVNEGLKLTADWFCKTTKE